MIERVSQIIREDRRRTIDEVNMLVGPDQWRNNTWLLHHDSAPAHAALLTRWFLTDNNKTVVPHPPYSPNLAPIDFFLFLKLKMELKGRRFQTLEEIQAGLQAVLKTL
jgi:transposase